MLSQKLLADAANLRQGAPNGSGGSSSADGLGNRGNILLLDPSTSDAVAASRIAELEARFHRVETALGDMSTFRQAVAAAVSGDGAEGSAAGPRSGSRGSVGASEDILSSVDNDAKGAPGGSFPGGLLGIVSALEKRVELLTPGKLDLVGKRVAVLSAELKNLMALRMQKAKMEGGSEASSEDQKVNELYGLLERLQGLDNELPSLVERLETLQGLHTQTATFAARLQALERATESARATLSSNEAAVSELEASVAANLEIMSKNVELLDAKLAK